MKIKNLISETLTLCASAPLRETKIIPPISNARILYFFSGQNVAILAHAIAKDENQVPDIEIERAIQRKTEFEVNPEVHTYVEEIEDGSDK